MIIDKNYDRRTIENVKIWKALDNGSCQLILEFDKVNHKVNKAIKSLLEVLPKGSYVSVETKYIYTYEYIAKEE